MTVKNQNLMTQLFALALLHAPIPAFAGPNASGGIPETTFQHDRAAITTILNTDAVLELLKDKGAITQIAAKRKDVFIIRSENCDLAVQFVRTCTFSSGLPQCDYSSHILRDESSANCQL